MTKLENGSVKVNTQVSIHNNKKPPKGFVSISHKKNSVFSSYKKFTLNKGYVCNKDGATFLKRE